MSIRILRLGSGGRFPLYAEQPRGLPDPYLAYYTVPLVRRLDFRTVYTTVGGIGICLRLCRAASIDLLDRCRSGEYLSRSELDALAKGLSKSGPTTAKPNYVDFLKYVGWLGRTLVRDLTEQDVRNKLLAAFVARAEDVRPAPPKPNAKPVLGLTEAQRSLFLSVIKPGHHRNPFHDVAYRNFVLMATAFNLGLRTSELLGLKWEDVSLSGEHGYVKVVVRPNDPDDPRRIPADQKTRPRELPLSPELTAAFSVLKRDRRRFPAARFHKYVFVNARGKPLSDRGARKQYDTLRKAVPELEDLINHRLRHDWNDRWLEMARELGWDLDDALRQQLYANGWGIGSSMPLRYGRREQQRVANETMLELQKRALRNQGPPA